MKHFFSLAFVLLLTGCGPTFNPAINRQAVVEKYSTDVCNVPDKRFTWIARKPDGSVWYVETYGPSDKLISAETQLFSANR